MPESQFVNAMTVDVEDYFQVSAFEKHIPRDHWDSIVPRVEENTDRILALFQDHSVHATFFILGWIAERFPQLVRRIEQGGHEIASHGYSHVRATTQNRPEFQADVAKTKKLLEDICGAEVRGFRAASFSIGEDNLWALEALDEVGYRYSSSIYPVRHDLYGMPAAPRFPFKHGDADLLEIPISTITIANRNWPCGGGGFFRLLPYAYSRWALRKINHDEGRPAVFYFHPWEIDPAQPRQRGLKLKTRFRHYINLAQMEKRLMTLMHDFGWSRMDAIYLNGSSN